MYNFTDESGSIGSCFFRCVRWTCTTRKETHKKLLSTYFCSIDRFLPAHFLYKHFQAIYKLYISRFHWASCIFTENLDFYRTYRQLTHCILQTSNGVFCAHLKTIYCTYYLSTSLDFLFANFYRVHILCIFRLLRIPFCILTYRLFTLYPLCL